MPDDLGQDVTTQPPATEPNGFLAALLAKAGTTAPSGGTIVGTLVVETIFSVASFDGDYKEASASDPEEVCVGGGAPVFIDSEGLCWVVGDGRWQPVSVEASPAEVEWLWPSPEEWGRVLAGARGAAGG
jgi:hypothetical protein